MRRAVPVFALLAAVGLLFTTACERSHVLRVADINGGRDLMCDVVDWRFTTDPEDPTDTTWSWIFFADDTAEVEFQYVEIGAGLPTWTPFHATITTYTVKYTSLNDPNIAYTDAVIPSSFSITADREGKKTSTLTLTLVPGWWKARTFGGRAEDEDAPEDGGIFDVLKGTVEFSAFDSVSGRDLTATGDFTATVGDLWDDISDYGQ
jgi:hypothetical protein